MIVFITGASSGIGRALALELAGRGHDLFLTARRLEELEPLPGRARRLDVTDSADVTAALEEAVAAFGRVDAVVANAGIGNSPKVGTGGFERDRAIVETNLIGAIATVDAAVAQFRRQGGGHVVGISSVAGVRGLPTSASYSASKAGLTAYLEGVRAETSREPITVTTIAPGFVDTPLNRGLRSRPFVIDAEPAARTIADRIEGGGGGFSIVPRWPWAAVVPLLRVLPTRLLARGTSRST
jgi:NAD(P)-dependent dehydrogenase (short-subunit alcohol dehydrogenase family)